VDRARANWDVATEAVGKGIRPEEIQVGFEWEGAHLCREALRRFDLVPPFDLDAGYPWTPMLNFSCGIQVRPTQPVDVIASRSFRPFLSRRAVEVGIYKQVSRKPLPQPGRTHPLSPSGAAPGSPRLQGGIPGASSPGEPRR
jgi:hypothetical protein